MPLDLPTKFHNILLYILKFIGLLVLDIFIISLTIRLITARSIRSANYVIFKSVFLILSNNDFWYFIDNIASDVKNLLIMPKIFWLLGGASGEVFEKLKLCFCQSNAYLGFKNLPWLCPYKNLSENQININRNFV